MLEDHTQKINRSIEIVNKEWRDSAFTLSTNFEGGSATILTGDPLNQTIRIMPAGDPARGMPTWWYLRLDHVDATRPVNVEVVPKDAVLPTDVPGKTQRLPSTWTWPIRASYSTDGKTWKQTQPGEKSDSLMRYNIPAGSSTVWVAWGPPFTPADAHALISDMIKKYAFATTFTLATTREGRAVPCLKINEGTKPARERPAIWVHARQHAWETGSSWVAKGFINWILSNDAAAKWLREHTEIYVVPIMDIDHVATGDGGKNALPQDHNRDWSETPHYPEIAATQKQILSLSMEGRMNILLDLHNPGPASTLQAFYILDKAYSNALAAPRLERFMALAKEQFGTVRQIDSKPPLQNPDIFYRVCDTWAAFHANPQTIAICSETPWNTLAGTVEGFQEAGAKLGRIVTKLLEEETN